MEAVYKRSMAVAVHLQSMTSSEVRDSLYLHPFELNTRKFSSQSFEANTVTTVPICHNSRYTPKKAATRCLCKHRKVGCECSHLDSAPAIHPDQNRPEGVVQQGCHAAGAKINRGHLLL